MPHLPPPNFMLDARPATTLPIYPGLGQAPNMLDCIPGGLVRLGLAGRQGEQNVCVCLSELIPELLCTLRRQ